MLKVLKAMGLVLWTLVAWATPVVAAGQPCELQEVAKILPSDGAAGDRFASSLAIDGGRAVVGADRDDDNRTNSGSAYVFSFDGDTWGQDVKLTAADANNNDNFGQSVGINGNTIMVGAPSDNSSQGAVYVFEEADDLWTESAKLLASDRSTDDRFGGVLTLTDDVVLVSATGDDDNGSASGSVYVFRFDGFEWNQEAKLLPSDGQAGDGFGSSIALANDIAIIGASSDDNGRGSAYVFYYNGASWTERQKLVASDGDQIDSFGTAVSLSTSHVVIGAYQDHENGLQSGSAYVFVFDGEDWVEQQKLLASDGSSRDFFGRAVALLDGRILIGAYGDDDNGDTSGSVYVFRSNGDLWTETAKVSASDGRAGDFFGLEFAISGEWVLVGARGNSDLGASAGACYAFQLCSSGGVQLVAPAGNISLEQGQEASVSWLVDGVEPGALRLFYGPDTPAPWDLPAEQNQLALPPGDVIPLTSGQQSRSLVVPLDLPPGDWCIWGEAETSDGTIYRSRAPGVLTVTERDPMDEPPTPDVDANLPYAYSPWVANPEATKFFVVTHGIDSWLCNGEAEDHGWIDEVRDAAAIHVSSSNGSAEWEIASLNWATGLPPGFNDDCLLKATKVAIAAEVGQRAVFEQLSDRPVEHVELVAHSRGAELVRGMAWQIGLQHPDATVTIHLLDGFIPGEYQLPETEVSILNYYDIGDAIRFLGIEIGRTALPFTQVFLDEAFNVDVSARRSGSDTECPDYTVVSDGPDGPYNGSEHGTPWAWFRDSAVASDATWFDDLTYELEGVPAPLGFKASRAWTPGDDSDWNLASYPAGNLFRIGDVCSSGRGTPLRCGERLLVEHRDPIRLFGDIVASGGDGEIRPAIVPNTSDGALAITAGSGSHWVTFRPSWTRVVSAVRYEAELSPQNGSEPARLFAYVQGQLYDALQQGQDLGTNESGFVFQGPTVLASPQISFKLEAGDTPDDSAVLRSVRTAVLIDADINGDCVLDTDDLCAWADARSDLDLSGEIDQIDLELLADAVGVSEADADGDGLIDVCQPCIADVNGDGVLSPADFSAWVIAFNSQSPECDQNGNGLCEPSDFSAWVINYNVGCL